jgi:hypothetical protein
MTVISFIIIDDNTWIDIENEVFAKNFYSFDKVISKLINKNKFNKNVQEVIIQFPAHITNEQIEEIQLKDPYNMLYTFHKFQYFCVRVVRSSIEYLDSIYCNEEPSLPWLDEDQVFDSTDEI